MNDSSTEDLLESRNANWGNPIDTHIRIADVWSGILGITVTPTQVALCMTGMKLVRASINPDEPDSFDDAAAYVRIADMIMRG